MNRIKKIGFSILTLMIIAAVALIFSPVTARADTDDGSSESDVSVLSAESSAAVTGFVERLYNYCLGRGSDEQGLLYWTEKLLTDELGGYECARGFFESNEFIGKGLTDDEFVAVLYNVLLDREPDDAGMLYWTNRLTSGQNTRSEIFSLFCDSQEFLGLCSGYGISNRASRGRYAYPEAAAVLDQCGWNLRAGYDWCVRNISYVRDQNVNDNNYSSRQMAHMGLVNRGGNCYVYAASFYEIAKCLGYDAHQISGFVPSRRGGLTIHSWVEIDMDGTTYVFDPEFEYAGAGRDGWQFHYGRRATWQYASYHRMN